MSVPEVIAFASEVVLKMTGNAFFTTPSPALVKITTGASALQTAFNNAQGGGTQQTAVMRQKREALETLLTAEGHYVEDIANDPVNAATGADVIILSAGMLVKRFSPHQKRVFTVERGKLPGTVILVAERAERGFHEWEYMLADKANALDLSDSASWIPVDSTLKATVTISGLESTRKYFFRHRLVLKEGPAPWDGTIDIIVL